MGQLKRKPEIAEVLALWAVARGETTTRRMADLIGVGSNSTVQIWLRRLEVKGWLRRDGFGRSGIRLMPDGWAHLSRYGVLIRGGRPVGIFRVERIDVAP